MSQEDDDSTKSEDPSEQKLKKAKEKGDVPITKEAGHIASYVAILVFISLLAPIELPKLAGNLSLIIHKAPGLAISSGVTGMSDLNAVLRDPVIGVAVFIAKVLGIFMVASLVAATMQGPFVVSAERIRPKLSKMNPGKGIKRLLGAENLVEFLKNLVKLCLIIAMTLWLVWDILEKLLPGAALIPEYVTPAMGYQASIMLVWICALMVPVAIADMFWKRYSHFKKQRMSMKEVRDEHKNSEGDPQIKGKRDQIRRARAKARLATAVPTATMVVTNPTHYAVAIRYERGVDVAPVCVAKGADLVAARIRTLAHDNEIPVIESRALARALHAVADVDQPIPDMYWQAVAELVGFVFDMRKRIKRKLPEGASLRED